MRAQTPLDFLVGASIFLLAVAVVAGAMPGMLDPFVLGDTAEPQTADRIATSLATDELGSPERPYHLQESAIDDFFARSPAEIRSDLAVPERTSVNVTLGTESVGPSIPEATSVSTARRLVAVDGTSRTLRVTVW